MTPLRELFLRQGEAPGIASLPLLNIKSGNPVRITRVLKATVMTRMTQNRRMRRMGEYAWIIVLIGWLVLMKFILPRFGVST
jgi:hypothetical protein